MASRKIRNSFFDLIAFVLSMCMGFIRSIQALLGKTPQKMKQSFFFSTLHFIFSTWPRYFWKAPSIYKALRFPGDIIDYIFKK